jgi:2,3-dihydro-2,3-dihydroxybenzoate dehydrogenase
MSATATDGRLAVVTGAASGIGAAVARGLAASGVSIAAVDADEERLEGVVSELQAHGHLVCACAIDVCDARAVENFVTVTERDIGPIEILVNVAGVLRMSPLMHLCDEDWAAMFAVNTTGVFNMSRAVAKSMISRHSGCIVTVASNASRVPRIHMGGYAASKAASTMLTKCFGLELARYGIRCNVVSPGSTDTPMLHSTWSSRDDRQVTLNGSLAAFRVGIPLQKLARPEDVADAVAFLVSDSAGHITMQDLYVDGGAALGA